ncbi:hypothetical protein VNO80_19038 [Phaseolus coccineus]|uniref:Uncharacterized protein n=1 Tax=Phaseolus coccineus TaxID=3886 RepID=A0AAN9MLG2_PHACN
MKGLGGSTWLLLLQREKKIEGRKGVVGGVRLGIKDVRISLGVQEGRICNIDMMMEEGSLCVLSKSFYYNNFAKLKFKDF